MGLLKSTVRADELQSMVDAFNAKLRKYLGRTSSPWTWGSNGNAGHRALAHTTT